MEWLNAYRGRNDPKAGFTGFEKDRAVLVAGCRPLRSGLSTAPSFSAGSLVAIPWAMA
jgi:hypothetical protein